MEKETKKVKNCFIEGPISASFIGEAIQKHQSKTNIGAHQIFLGQVRSDIINDQSVVAIEYSAYEEMANTVFQTIREEAFKSYDLVCLHIYHSIGRVVSGEICLFVFVSSKHRKMAQEALTFIVEKIKSEVPVFGKECLENQNHVWKINH